MRGQIKEWWGKLTDDELEKIGGKFDKLIGLLPGEVWLHPTVGRRGIQPAFKRSEDERRLRCCGL
jgi:hypothetical protein